jgi:acetyl esterase
MHVGHPARRSRRPFCARTSAHAVRPAVAALTAVLAVTLSGCGSGEPNERLAAPSTVDAVEEGITYWSGGGVDLKLDACLPEDADESTRAIVIVHGGGFTEGDRESGGSRALCEASARLGAAAFSIDYRFVPEYVYPAQVDDLANAVRWLRQPNQVTRFGIDPARIGVLGSSAGAIIAQTLATRGQGPRDTGDRVGAVVSLSGVSVMSPEGLQLGNPGPQAADLVLDYLGCTDPAACPQAVPASPVTAVDPTDPPMLLVNGTGELVPVDQAQAMDAALTGSGVDCELLVIDAPDHGAALLTTEVRQRALTFLEEHL